ncbi:lipocalin family protein [uncultured Tenacibaculum sp.]|uniref:lipocalin family protein n=1 Tax=uncultured Tenacibaculum sp. TaxID=174713 RepID=UPI0026231FF7|nr:lipocalin family protein [uncultured Tenacibaculum sp.]
MKIQSINLKSLALFFISITALLSCSDNTADLPEENNTVFNELLGTWLIQSSSVNGTPVNSASFDCLKTSVAKFTATNYELNYRKKGTGAFASGCAVTQQFSGTYEVNQNGVVDLNSSRGITAEIKEGKLIITTEEGSNKQVDTFINEKDIVNTVLDTDNGTSTGGGTTNPPAETDEFKNLKEKLQGKWGLNSFEINGEAITLSSCRATSFIEFKDQNNKIFIFQSKATFTQGDLRKYGIGIGGSGIQSVKATKSTSNGENSDKVTFDTDASCKFKKESTRVFEHVSGDVLRIKTRSIEFKLVNDTTIELTFKNSDTNTEGKQIYKKL